MMKKNKVVLNKKESFKKTFLRIILTTATFCLLLSVNAIAECPTGYTEEGNLCIGLPDCEGDTFDPALDKCIKTPEYSCPSGYSLDGTVCYKNPVCPNGSSLNPSTGECEKATAYRCSLTGETTTNQAQCQNDCVNNGSCGLDTYVTERCSVFDEMYTSVTDPEFPSEYTHPDYDTLEPPGGWGSVPIVQRPNGNYPSSDWVQLSLKIVNISDIGGMLQCVFVCEYGKISDMYQCSLTGDWYSNSSSCSGACKNDGSCNSECPSGMTQDGTLCKSDACSGDRYANGRCEIDATPYCSGNFTLNGNNTLCQKDPDCPYYGLYKPATDKCELGHWKVGAEITAPAGADLTLIPETADPSDAEKIYVHPMNDSTFKVYARSPGSVTVNWYYYENISGQGLVKVAIPKQASIGWPLSPQIHIGGSAPVDLLPSGSVYSLAEDIYHTQSYPDVPEILGGQFSNSYPGFTVLKFTNGGSDIPEFTVVLTVSWKNTDYLSEENWFIGDEIVSSYHNPPSGDGYVFNEISPYAVNTETEAPFNGYNRTTRTGPIVAINNDYNLPSTDNDLVVVWYQRSAKGVDWPYKPVRYDPQWATSAPIGGEIVIASGLGSGTSLTGYTNVQLYYQNDSAQPGFNPNEEHAVVLDKVAYALRNDLNRNDTSDAHLVLRCEDNAGNWDFKTFQVTRETALYPFSYSSTVGISKKVWAPMPLSSVLFTSLDEPEETCGFTGGNTCGNYPDSLWWEDYDGNLYAKKAGTGTARFHYELKENFFYDVDPGAVAGDIIPWLDRRPGGTVGVPVDVSCSFAWPSTIPEIHIGETLITPFNGLPDIKNQCSVDLLYDEGEASGNGASVKLLDAVTTREVSLPGGLPADIKKKDELNHLYSFTDLAPQLKNRVFYDYANETLQFNGVFDDSMAGTPLLLRNIMTDKEKTQIAGLTQDPSDTKYTAFQNAVEALFTETRSYIDGEEEIVGSNITKILTAADQEGGIGYVTLAFNDSESACYMNQIDIQVVKVVLESSYKGDIKYFESENAFDEKVVFKHSGGFGGNADDFIFEWKYAYPTTEGSAPDLPNINPGAWNDLVTESQGIADVVIGGAGIEILKDKFITCRFRGYSRNNDGNNNISGVFQGSEEWSDWTAPALYENWVKRTMAKINPFEQRVNELHTEETATYVSMIQQAGGRYEGDIALNGDADNLNSIGLIEFYETLLRKAKEASIDQGLDDADANNTILFATSRLSDLYMLIGNEAYADAVDPTIGFTTSDGQVGTAAPKMFCFENKLTSLLSEELGLLRGRDDSKLPGIDTAPYYNRLDWNFTGDSGELAYVMNYDVATFDEAKQMYPQGHGDAWGHYLTSVKKYYDLLRHESFTWVPRAESVNVGGVPVDVDFKDERKFAAAAAAKARTGAEIVNLTYREKYVDNPAGQWQGYKDSDSDRAWGLSEWASRAGQGAYLDWIVANAVLPSEDTVNTGIQKIDRRTVAELHEIASHLIDIQSEVDKADKGLNPLGLAKDVIPFDISPQQVENGISHFEQIYERAVKAMNNAISVFNHANQNTQMLRKQQDTLADYQDNVEEREADFNNRLVEVYGTPYSDDMGPGKTYASDYNGPDIYHYDYYDASNLMDKKPGSIITFEIEVHDFLNVDDNGALVETTKDVTFHISNDGFGFMTPESWTGSRRVTGEIQMARSDLVQAKARLERGMDDYENLLVQIENEAELLEAQYNLNLAQINIMYGTQAKQMALNDAITRSRSRQFEFRKDGRMASIIANATAEALPQMTGFIGGAANGIIADLTSAARSAIMLAGTVINESMTRKADNESMVELDIQQAKEMVQSQSSIEITSLQNDFAILQKLKQIEQMIRQEATLRLDLYMLQESLLQSTGRYTSVMGRGERIMADRTRFRKQVAGNILEYRHKDMAFRVFRNDALQKYRAQFDLASRYVYLAAKAYDYDTCLLDTNSSAGEGFLTDIVKQRTIGEIGTGGPIAGSGLAGKMAEMSANFDVLKPQMGINNPTNATTKFSLRKELFRIGTGIDSGENWKDTLTRSRVENLWDVPEFRSLCQMGDDSIVQPGIVITFSTNITQGMNFFGWPYGGGDNIYNPNNMATKISGAGVWFTNYETTNLGNTPLVYLVPAGDDTLRLPFSNSVNTRLFDVIEQQLPLPYDIQANDLSNPDWLPTDNLGGIQMFSIRQYDGFRAQHDADDSLISQGIQKDTRLIGRSVWNTKWMLIIPGIYMNADADAALDEFISNITDIKFVFDTYSYDGL